MYHISIFTSSFTDFWTPLYSFIPKGTDISVRTLCALVHTPTHPVMPHKRKLGHRCAAFTESGIPSVYGRTGTSGFIKTRFHWGTYLRSLHGKWKGRVMVRVLLQEERSSVWFLPFCSSGIEGLRNNWMLMGNQASGIQPGRCRSAGHCPSPGIRPQPSRRKMFFPFYKS